MKIRNLFLVLIATFSFSLAQAYDGTWFQSAGWSGEYPPGFQVYKKGIKVLGRTSINKNEVPSVECVLKRNSYAPGKSLPHAEYVQMSKIVEMTVKADTTYPIHTYNPVTENFDESALALQAGDTVEYLTYMAEGWFFARHNGVIFEADQSLFDMVDYSADTDFAFDQWINLSCVNNVNVWLMLSDLQPDLDENVWIDGVRSFFFNPY